MAHLGAGPERAGEDKRLMPHSADVAMPPAADLVEELAARSSERKAATLAELEQRAASLEEELNALRGDHERAVHHYERAARDLELMLEAARVGLNELGGPAPKAMVHGVDA